MGIAKYSEDNVAISNGRLRQRDLRQNDYVVRTPKENCIAESTHKKQHINKEACIKSTHGSFLLESCVNFPVSKFIRCKDCKIKFEFDVNEQNFFTQKGWKNPSRCLRCRRNNRERRKNQRCFPDISNSSHELIRNNFKERKNLVDNKSHAYNNDFDENNTTGLWMRMSWS